MNSYEEQRQARIRRNQALLNELGIERKNAKAATTSNGPPAKKRKITSSTTTISSRPTRTSARIASAPQRPTYDEKDLDEVPARSRKSTSTNRPKTTSANIVASALPSPSLSISELQESWHWKPIAEPPTLTSTGTYFFPSHPDFTPNTSPLSILSQGAFGGTYYRAFHSSKLRSTIPATDYLLDLPPSWISTIGDVDSKLLRTDYDESINKYGVKCGQSIEEWEASGWIRHEYDVRGWMQWYIRFFQGRRCEDDERQVGRWKRCVGERGRWRRALLKKYIGLGIRSVADEGGGDEEEDEREVSPVLCQTCLHWAWEVRQEELDQVWRDGL